MSKEYIEKEAFIAELKDRQEEARRWLKIASCQENRVRADAAICAFAEIKQTLLAIPPADVKPVVRGEWIYGKEIARSYLSGECVSIHYEDIKCSVCKTRYQPYVGSFNFCPNCGADMREEANDER